MEFADVRVSQTIQQFPGVRRLFDISQAQEEIVDLTEKWYDKHRDFLLWDLEDLIPRKKFSLYDTFSELTL